MRKVKQFDTDDVEIDKEIRLYDGFFKIQSLSLKHACFDGRWTETFNRELCLRNDAVGVLLYDPETDQVALVEQFRVGALHRDHSPWLLEVVAGMIDKDDERPIDVAIRETQEEAGLEIITIEPMMEYLVSPGGSSERFSLFIGRVSLKGNTGGHFGLASEHEDIRLHVISVEQVFEWLNQGRINNSMTIIALQWFMLNKASLDQRWL